MRKTINYHQTYRTTAVTLREQFSLRYSNSTPTTRLLTGTEPDPVAIRTVQFSGGLIMAEVAKSQKMKVRKRRSESNGARDPTWLAFNQLKGAKGFKTSFIRIDK